LKEGPVDHEAYDKQDRTANDQRNQGANSKDGVQRPGGKGPEHNEFPMRDVQYSPNAVLKAESHGDEGVDTPHD